MEKFWLLIFSILPLACSSEETLMFVDPDQDMIFARSTMMEFVRMDIEEEEEVELQCRSWRVSVEANNVNPWKMIPKECGDYVEAYMTGRDYELDLQRVSNEAQMYAILSVVNLSRDGKDAWIFDVDETLLSNLPYYAHHHYGLEIYDSMKFDRWIEMGMAPAIESSLRLYEEVSKLGFKVILLTGRSERHRNVTMENLLRAGFLEWEKLILRSTEDDEKTAIEYKSEKRKELVEEGYRLVGNSGDQWSDLLGPSMSIRSFKLPNPMYYIP